MASASTTVNIHDTDVETWDALERVFGSLEAENAHWIHLECDGVHVNFFKSKDEVVDEDES